jgi:adenylosuccinate lyase
MTMLLSQLSAISPIDGRYAKKTEMLRPIFSEYGLIYHRVLVEVRWIQTLASHAEILEVPNFSNDANALLESIINDFNEQDAQRIKDIEKITNHDVKAVEYFIKEKFDNLNLHTFKEFIHFGLTSQDINNTAIPLSLKDALIDVYYPQLDTLVNKLASLSDEWKDIPMLARTHGQPASPTRLGKELYVFVERINQQLKGLKVIPHAAKFGGATGNFNAHKVAYPAIDWKAFGTQFVEKGLGLHHSFPTTQIEHYDHLAGLFDALKRINTILIDLNRDIWTYVSTDYFKQKIKAGEVGSSAMPHKVNPIDFENSEGNLGMANAIFEHLSAKLPISRLQRDLTDSTVLRNIGVPIGHTIIAFASTLKGLNKLLINKDKFAIDLENNWAVVAEAIQTILRREAYPNPYEALKGLTRTNEKITQQSIAQFIDTLEVSDEIKTELKVITPSNYTGI